VRGYTGSAPTNVTAKLARTALIAALFCLGAGTALLIQHRSRVELDRQNQALQRQIEELARLAAENERLSTLVAQATSAQTLPNGQLRELLKLRGEVGRLRQQSQEAERLRSENQRLRIEAGGWNRPAGNASPGAASQNNVPKESWNFAGYATPEDAFQSAVWAISRGDVKTLYASLTEEGRQKIEGEEKGQPESDLAAKGVEVMGKFKAYRAEGREDQPDGSIVLTVSMIRPDDTPETERMTVKRVGAEWKLAPE
jgi:hypothetical protein